MITIKSHGFKFSRPEANIIFDVSYFINPWRDPEIRDHKGSKEELKDKINAFMVKQEGVYDFAKGIADLLVQYGKLFPNENIQVAICCSAGEYRSPAMVEIVSKLMGSRTNHKVQHSPNSKL